MAFLKDHGFEIITWDDESIKNFIKEKAPFALMAFEQARNHGEASDIARYLIIYHHGGYYVDWDIKLTRIDLFLNLHREFRNGYLLIDPKTGVISSEHFAASANEGYLLKITHDIINTFNNGDRPLMDTPSYSGPNRMKVSLQKHNGSRQTVIPIKTVFEYDYWEIKKADGKGRSKPMIHYWLNTWVLANHAKYPITNQ
ncbi:glycosyltransferase [Mucilaginibacter antarcticus]|uniref:glycosyltransferase n=1 Tax=Mucilaginibacter antarcticus TaxID=1855725 RepID=UPI0036414862